MQSNEETCSKSFKEKYCGQYGDIAEVMGENIAEEIHKNFAGSRMEFPKRLYTTKYMVDIMSMERQNGATVPFLAKKYGYTERRVRQLLERGN